MTLADVIKIRFKLGHLSDHHVWNKLEIFFVIPVLISYTIASVYSKKMPYGCVVPKCKGNYKNGPKVHVFSFPKEEKFRQAWIKAIKRDNFTPTQHSKVSIYFCFSFYFHSFNSTNTQTSQIIACYFRIIHIIYRVKNTSFLLHIV